MDIHSKGRIHILSGVSTLATTVAWKLWGEFAMHPAKKLLMKKMPIRLSIQEQNLTKKSLTSILQCQFLDVNVVGLSLEASEI